jgi:hypothetical protein
LPPAFRTGFHSDSSREAMSREELNWREVTKQKEAAVDEFRGVLPMEEEAEEKKFLKEFEKAFRSAGSLSATREARGMTLIQLLKSVEILVDIASSQKPSSQGEVNEKLVAQREEYNRELERMREECREALLSTKEENESLRRDLLVVRNASEQIAVEEEAVVMRCHELQGENEELIEQCHLIQEENMAMKRDIERLLKSARELQ